MIKRVVHINPQPERARCETGGCRLRWSQLLYVRRKPRVFQSFTTGMFFLQPLCGCQSFTVLCISHLASEFLDEQTRVEPFLLRAAEALCTLISHLRVTRSHTHRCLNTRTENQRKHCQSNVWFLMVSKGLLI